MKRIFDKFSNRRVEVTTELKSKFVITMLSIKQYLKKKKYREYLEDRIALTAK
jgi:hypothetical protein